MINRPIRTESGQFWIEEPGGCWTRIGESQISHGVYWAEPKHEEMIAYRAARNAAFDADRGGKPFDPFDMGFDFGPHVTAFLADPANARFRAFEDFATACADSAGQ